MGGGGGGGGGGGDKASHFCGALKTAVLTPPAQHGGTLQTQPPTPSEPRVFTRARAGLPPPETAELEVTSKPPPGMRKAHAKASLAVSFDTLDVFDSMLSARLSRKAHEDTIWGKAKAAAGLHVKHGRPRIDGPSLAMELCPLVLRTSESSWFTSGPKTVWQVHAPLLQHLLERMDGESVTMVPVTTPWCDSHEIFQMETAKTGQRVKQWTRKTSLTRLKNTIWRCVADARKKRECGVWRKPASSAHELAREEAVAEYPWFQHVRVEAVGSILREIMTKEKDRRGSAPAYDQDRCTCVKQTMEKETDEEDSLMMHYVCQEYACLPLSDMRCFPVEEKGKETTLQEMLWQSSGLSRSHVQQGTKATRWSSRRSLMTNSCEDPSRHSSLSWRISCRR